MNVVSTQSSYSPSLLQVSQSCYFPHFPHFPTGKCAACLWWGKLPWKCDKIAQVNANVQAKLLIVPVAIIFRFTWIIHVYCAPSGGTYERHLLLNFCIHLTFPSGVTYSLHCLHCCCTKFMLIVVALYVWQAANEINVLNQLMLAV